MQVATKNDERIYDGDSLSDYKMGGNAHVVVKLGQFLFYARQFSCILLYGILFILRLCSLHVNC
jgi:hypothetical protein